MRMFKFLFCAAVLAVCLNACNKDADKAKSTLAVRMTDAPAAYNAVNIDLQAVEVTGSGGASVMLNVTPGIYNLLDYANGLDTLIATGTLEGGTEIQQIRLILGSNNSIVVDNVTHPLSTPSADQSGLKLQVHKTLEPGVAYSILLDFDANQSIVETGNGTYKLKPVVRTIEAAVSGSVTGSIAPAGVVASVTATSSGGVSYSSAVAANGSFLIAGLPAGTYSVTITPVLPYLPVTINNVTVTTGVVTQVGVTNL
jgi:hypothetical protein